METTSTRVLIVDDCETVRDGLSFSLSLYDNIIVVGSACNGQEAYTLCRDLKPDIVLMDVYMPVMDGLTATAHICQLAVGTKVILISQEHTSTLASRAYAAGAYRCIPKYALEDIYRVIQEAVP